MSSAQQPPKRKSISLQVKREVIKRKEEGQGNSAIGRAMNLHEATVRTIWKKREEILEMYESYGASGVDSRKYASSASKELVKMERDLALWINRKEGEGVAIDKKQIMNQARVFYKSICKKNRVLPFGFKASTGWLYRFLERKNIRRIKLTADVHSADEVAAKEFPSILKGIIEEGGYHPNAVYNMDEVGLQYKKMPKSTFIAKKARQAQGRKADQSRFTVLFCVNSSGTHKMKPLIVHTAKHPRCFNHLSDMKDAPVYWRSSTTGWMTSSILEDWFLHCFVPEARRQCQKDGREFKVILTLDKCPAHPSFLDGLHPNVRVVFLPPNTTSLIQPLDQVSCIFFFFFFYKNYSIILQFGYQDSVSQVR